jgi:GH24 family phage-related lysozyme (muramidase)
MTPTDYRLAAHMIAFFEGYLPVARWDVNAWRLGYGSDTKGAEQAKVVRGDTETQVDAFANLQARIPEFERIIISQVGLTRWDALPQIVRAALLSFAYNYGELTPTLEKIVATQSKLDLISNAIYDRHVDNGGVNSLRRQKEAFAVYMAG